MSIRITVTAKGFRIETRTGITLTAGATVGADFALTVGTSDGNGYRDGKRANAGYGVSGSFDDHSQSGGHGSAEQWPQSKRSGDCLRSASSTADRADTFRASRANTPTPSAAWRFRLSLTEAAATTGSPSTASRTIPPSASPAPHTPDLLLLRNPCRKSKSTQSIFDAQVGHGNGTVTDAILKSGGNKFHGAAYYAFQNTYLNANTSQKSTPRPRLRVPIISSARPVSCSTVRCLFPRFTTATTRRILHGCLRAVPFTYDCQLLIAHANCRRIEWRLLRSLQHLQQLPASAPPAFSSTCRISTLDANNNRTQYLPQQQHRVGYFDFGCRICQLLSCAKRSRRHCPNYPKLHIDAKRRIPATTLRLISASIIRSARTTPSTRPSSRRA